MIKRVILLAAVIVLAYLFSPLVKNVLPSDRAGELGEHYARQAPREVGTANTITAVVVTYRGLDTLGEVAVLFAATAGVGLVLSGKQKKEDKVSRPASELLNTGSSYLLVLLFLFGAYIFVHGHLTPGGGFQGGVVIASGILLLMLSRVSLKLNQAILHLTESLSGFTYVVLGILGIILAAGFLDNRFLPLGTPGRLFSAGAVPLIYSLIGLKVGAEITGILEKMKK